MIQWIIIGVFILVSIWYLQMEHHTRRVKIVFIIIIVAILYFSMMGIFSSEKVDLTSPRGVVNAVYVYFGWMGKTIGSLWDIGTDTTHTVGNAIKMNGSNTNEENSPRVRLIGRES